MEVKRIMCCCGQGLGSSMIVAMNVEKALKNIGVSGVSVEHTALSEITQGCAELFVVGNYTVQIKSDLDDMVRISPFTLTYTSEQKSIKGATIRERVKIHKGIKNEHKRSKCSYNPSTYSKNHKSNWT